MPELASPFWQNVLIYAAGLFLLWEIIGGWRRGVIRAGLHFGAFVLSGIVGMMAGQAVAAVIGVVLPGVAFFAGIGVGLCVALFILGACLFLSAVLFKRTSHQPEGLVRTLFGLGGAFFGLLTGLFILWGGISIIRASGAIAQSSLASTHPAQASGLLQSLAVLKASLESGSVGEMSKAVDIFPTDTYDRIVKIGKLSSNPDAMMRFVTYEGVQKVIAHPRMQALFHDQEAMQAAESKDYFALFRNRALLDAVSDPSLQKLVMSLDLEKALDYAMPPTQNPTIKKSKP